MGMVSPKPPPTFQHAPLGGADAPGGPSGLVTHADCPLVSGTHSPWSGHCALDEQTRAHCASPMQTEAEPNCAHKDEFDEQSAVQRSSRLPLCAQVRPFAHGDEVEQAAPRLPPPELPIMVPPSPEPLPLLPDPPLPLEQAIVATVIAAIHARHPFIARPS